MRAGRKSGVAALALALAALAAAWGVARPGAPPLYDGPQVVAPYRYLCIPEGYSQSQPASPKSADVAVHQGVVEGGGVFVTTDEAPVGQVQVLINGEDLALPPGAGAISVTVTPVVPPATLPADGRLVGNVYTVALTAAGQPLSLKPGKMWTAVLRGPANGPTLVLEQLTGSAWVQLKTQPVGQPDIFAGNATTFGTVALVAAGPPETSPPAVCRTFDKFGSPGGGPASSGAGTGSGGGGGDGGRGSTVAVGAVLGGLVLVGLAILAVRSRRPSVTPKDAEGRGSGRSDRRR